MSIDVLVIKNEQKHKVTEKYRTYFQKYNLVEYKSPTDYISIRLPFIRYTDMRVFISRTPVQLTRYQSVK